jgi:hypothetical protein
LIFGHVIKYFERLFTYILAYNKTLMNDRKIILGVIVGITLVATLGATTIQQSAYAGVDAGPTARKAPPSITGDNIYVAWWTNKTGNDEVMFRASTDKGETFGDKINLSNTTNADSTRAEIDSDETNVVVTWWETNQTDDTPVMKVSTDAGKTFGPLLKLATNGTLGTGEAKPLLP